MVKSTLSKYFVMDQDPGVKYICTIWPSKLKHIYSAIQNNNFQWSWEHCNYHRYFRKYLRFCQMFACGGGIFGRRRSTHSIWKSGTNTIFRRTYVVRNFILRKCKKCFYNFANREYFVMFNKPFSDLKRWKW